jgi:hypothetical protein
MQDSGFTKKRADLIFCSVNRNKTSMVFETFLQALIKIGEFKYPGKHPSDALQSLVKSHLMPLHLKIHQSTGFHLGHDGGVFEIQFDELVSIVLKDIGPTLHEIYTVVFPHEIKAVRGFSGGMPEDDVLKANEKNLFEFLKDYDVCPSLLNKGIAFQLYLHTRN